MNTTRRITVLLVLPVTILLIVSVALLYAGFNRLKDLHNAAEEQQLYEINSMLDTALVARQLSSINLYLRSIIAKTENAPEQIDISLELKALNSMMSDRVFNHALMRDTDPILTRNLEKALSAYQDFILQLTHSPENPSHSTSHLLQELQYYYLNLTDSLSQATLHIAEQVRARNQQQIHNFSALVDRLFYLGACVLLVMFGISQALLLRASRTLLTIAQGLNTLAHSSKRQIKLPEIEKLQHHHRKDIRLIASRLLDLRHILEHRHTTEDNNFQLAFYDSLTHLPNRRLLQERIRQAVIDNRRNNKQSALLVIDIDAFKFINETRGHDAGDQVLIRVADCLNALAGETNTISRIGSNSFAVLMPGLSKDPNIAAGMVVRLDLIIKERLAELQIDVFDYSLTACTGTTFFDGYLKDTHAPLMEAETAMYRAKKQGRGMLCYYDAHIQAQQQKRQQLESDLRAAIPNQQLQLFYQLQVNSDARPIGVEALLRWHHPTQGLISPNTFIPIAEASDLILEMGQWVLETACHQLKAWESSPQRNTLSIAVNVSARQLRQDNFVSQVRQAIESSDANPKLLKLELTESMLLQDFESSIKKIKTLRELGVRFALDDFGTGYSSLQYLRRLPLDQLKIEQSFARDIIDDKHSATIVQTIIAMGRALGLEVLAEGVETQEQQDFLSQHGCNYYQGFLYSRPLPIEQIEALLPAK